MIGLLLGFLFLSIIAIDCYAEAKTPAAQWGQLKVVAGQLCAADGSPVQLRGISLADSTNYGELANTSSLKWLRDDWQATVFRAAMYTTLNNKFIGVAAFKAEFDIIQAAIDVGLYVIVDWHITVDADPRLYQEEAKDFFAQVATRFGKYPNIIYEICNEPTGQTVTWPDAIKPYAMAVIPVIRAIDPNNVIVVGTPNWSQQPQVAAADPLPFSNVMYVLHYYAGSHSAGGFFSAIDQAKAAGYGTFISEWGVTNSSGKGGIFADKSIAWSRGMDQRKLSWSNWALSNKVGESSSLLKPLVSNQGGWRFTELTESALLVRSLLRREATGPIFADGFDSGNLAVSGWKKESVMLDRTGGQAGPNSMRFEGKSTLTKTMVAETVTDLSLLLWYKTDGLTTNDSLAIECSTDGQTWNPVAAIKSSQASADWKQFTTKLPAMPNTAEKYLFRLRSDFKTETARLWLDELIVSGTRTGITP